MNPKQSVRLSAPAAVALSSLLILPLVFTVAFRGATRDTLLYREIFAATVRFPSDPVAYYAEHGVEWGYGVLSWLLNAFDAGPTLLFGLISATTFVFLALTARTLHLSVLDVLPYYLGTFFLTQQFMQIRQGLAIAVAFFFIARLVRSRHRALVGIVGMACASLGHLVAPLPLLVSTVVSGLVTRLRTRTLMLGVLVATLLTIGVCRQVAGLEALMSFEKLSQYAADQEFGSARSVFEPANVRAGLLLTLFYVSYPWMAKTALGRAYALLLVLYAVHFGIRIGFLEVQILSGRLSTAFGFSEVFLLALLMRSLVTSAVLRALCALVYLAVHVVLTLSVQVPYLLNDYFVPLHGLTA